MQSVQLCPRGLGTGGKMAPPPVPPKNMSTSKPAVLPKPQVRTGNNAEIRGLIMLEVYIPLETFTYTVHGHE